MGRYFLFASPSFVEGIGRLVDFGGTLTEFNSSPGPEMADARAVASDWQIIGCDLGDALNVVSAEAHRAESTNR